ncbi:MAG: 2-dehydro-3-deoxygalactonokinase [Acidobacteriota bacterium]
MSIQDEQRFTALCVDMGTTNTRIWLVQGGQILAKRQAGVGVRDTARDGSALRIRQALRELIADLLQTEQAAPQCLIAAGMITSPLGLAEVAHLSAPAGLSELADNVARFSFPDICALPVYLVPGIRSGNASASLADIGERDVMRGEETLCAGLVASGRITPPASILNLGSHWKWIELDAAGRVSGSITSLSGEMIHATQTTTILASAVPSERPETLADDWCAAGRREAQQSGLARALFCVRLLELAGQGTPEERMSYLLGAFIAADLIALQARGALTAGMSVYLTGGGAVAQGWQQALAAASVSAHQLAPDEIETALLKALQRIAFVASQRG